MPPIDTAPQLALSHDPMHLDPTHVDPMHVDPIAELVRPIAGVSIELYARVVKSIEMVNHDLSLLEPMAAAHGVPRDAWARARRGWNERIALEPAICALFQVLYRSQSS
jgi:hypothetical protein